VTVSAEHDAYFDPLRVSLPVGDENELIVECRAPEDRFGGIYDTDRVPANASVLVSGGARPSRRIRTPTSSR